MFKRFLSWLPLPYDLILYHVVKDIYDREMSLWKKYNYPISNIQVGDLFYVEGRDIMDEVADVTRLRIYGKSHHFGVDTESIIYYYRKKKSNYKLKRRTLDGQARIIG